MLVSHIDNFYIEWVKMFLLSLRRNLPDQEVFLSLVNLSSSQIEQLKDIFPNLKYSSRAILIPKGQSRQRFMQCRVSKVMLEAVNLDFNGKYIISNADMLFRKSLSEIYGLLDEYDFLLHFTKEHMQKKIPHQIQNGFMAFSCNPLVVEFLEYYDMLLWRKGSVVAYDDQVCLYQAYLAYKERLHFGSIPDSYIDGDFQVNSHVWSGHSHGRFQNFQKFQRALGLEVTKEKPKEFV